MPHMRHTAIILSKVRCSISSGLPAEFGGVFTLREASEAEFSANSERYSKVLENHAWNYENAILTESGLNIPRREESDIKYFVFEKTAIERKDIGFALLENALSLLQKSVTIGGENQQKEGSKPYMQSYSVQLGIYIETLNFNQPDQKLIEFTDGDLNFLNNLYSDHIDNFQQSSIHNAMRDLRNIALISSQVIPAHMSIIEGALTHPDDETGLQKNIARKMGYFYDTIFPRLVLCKHLQVPDWAALIGKSNGCPSATEIWKQLYELRSVIAHGSVPQFGQGKLKWLPSFEVAREVLLHGVKSLALYQIEHPQELEILRR